jgi:molybdopterin/thiamine biosynthesis adenylyltransferase
MKCGEEAMTMDELLIRFDSDRQDDRYARQKLIPWWDQERLTESSLVVVGAGALGNEVLKNLALLGIGHILVVDFDTIELSNLSRCVLFSAKDVGRPKAQVASEALQSLNSDVRVEWLCGDVELDLGLSRLREYDLVLGCLDSVNARWAINRSCMHAGVPWINAGINATAGEVAFFDPKTGPCYECGMTDGMWQRFNERYSCMLLAKMLPPFSVPTTAVVASLTASLQVNEAIAFLHEAERSLKPGQKLFFSLRPYSFFIVDTARDGHCGAHESYSPLLRIGKSASQLHARQILDSVKGGLSIELDFDLAVALSCPACADKEIIRPVKRLSLTDAKCPTCGAMRTPRTTHQISGTGTLATTRLNEIGISDDTILRVRTDEGTAYVSLK